MLNLKVGDSVALKSGSQPMTIWHIRPDDCMIDVVWVVGGIINRDAFSIAELVKVTLEDIKIVEA